MLTLKKNESTWIIPAAKKATKFHLPFISLNHMTHNLKFFIHFMSIHFVHPFSSHQFMITDEDRIAKSEIEEFIEREMKLYSV